MQSTDSEEEKFKILAKGFIKKANKWDIFSLTIILSLISFAGVGFNLLSIKSYENLRELLFILFILAFVSLVAEVEIKKIV